MKEIITKATLKIYNLYSRMFQTTKYEQCFSNVPVERLTYYPELLEMYLTVAYREDEGTSTYTARVPESLHKVVMAHASQGRRVMFFTDKNDTLGHIFFGMEADKEILRQIDEGIRPAGWGDPSHKGWGEWKKAQADIRHCDADGDMWGFAKVLKGNPPYLGFKEADKDN
jgi:hypothetical protein